MIKGFRFIYKYQSYCVLIKIRLKYDESIVEKSIFCVNLVIF